MVKFNDGVCPMTNCRICNRNSYGTLAESNLKRCNKNIYEDATYEDAMPPALQQRQFKGKVEFSFVVFICRWAEATWFRSSSISHAVATIYISLPKASWGRTGSGLAAHSFPNEGFEIHANQATHDVNIHLLWMNSLRSLIREKHQVLRFQMVYR